jgi:thiamine biosynthesis lipoprotein
MPFIETLPVDEGTAQWPMWSTTARVVITDPERLADARAVVADVCAEVERAASRFQQDSEVSQLADRGAHRQPVSDVLAALVAVALDAAGDTDGAVTPALGSVLCDLGYDRDWTQLRRTPAGEVGAHLTVRTVPDWRDITLETCGEGNGRRNLLTVPKGVLLDLGSTAKAWAADEAAHRVAAEIGCGVLVALGGDLAMAGPVPAGGWVVLVHDGDAATATTVQVHGPGGVATSSTSSRRWWTNGRMLHHLIDPVTARPARSRWRTATVVAPDCVTANTCATATLVLGDRGEAWLRRQQLPARLVSDDGNVRTLSGWPVEGLARTERRQDCAP